MGALNAGVARTALDHDWNTATNTGTPSIAKWNWDTESSDRLLTPTGAKTNNSTKGNPALQADLLGDWREELAWPSADSTELRIYTTSRWHGPPAPYPDA